MRALLAVFSSLEIDEGTKGLTGEDSSSSTTAGHLRGEGNAMGGDLGKAFGREGEVAGGEAGTGFAKGELKGREALGDGVGFVRQFPGCIAFFLVDGCDANRAKGALTLR